MASFVFGQVKVKSRAVHLIFSFQHSLLYIIITMSYSWAIIIFAALFGITSAAPSLLPRQAATTQLTFTGAGASFSVNAPVDGSAVSLSKQAPCTQPIPTTKLTLSHRRQYPGRRLHRSSRHCELFFRRGRWGEAHRTWSQLRGHHCTSPDDRACQLPIALVSTLEFSEGNTACS